MATGLASYSLLLLPPPPSDLSFYHLTAAYGPSLSFVLKRLLDHAAFSQRVARLDIAVSTSILQDTHSSRAQIFGRAQKLLAGIYRLICVISAKDSIELDGPSGVDPRIFLMDYDQDRDSKISDFEGRGKLQGPIIDLPTLAFCPRLWEQIYSVESEQGEGLLKVFSYAWDFRAAKDPRRPVQRVPGGLVMLSRREDASASVVLPSLQSHYSVAVGGTFDHLHAGHKLLLTATALALEPNSAQESERQRTLIIGITGDEMLTQKKFAEYLESWDERQNRVSEFLESTVVFSSLDGSSQTSELVSEPGPNGKFVHKHFGSDLDIKYVQISDPFGPTITDESISALVISKETRSGGKAVNDRRKDKGWSELEVFEVEVLDTQELDDESADSNQDNFQSKISSTEMRRLRMERATGKGNL